MTCDQDNPPREGRLLPRGPGGTRASESAGRPQDPRATSVASTTRLSLPLGLPHPACMQASPAPSPPPPRVCTHTLVHTCTHTCTHTRTHTLLPFSLLPASGGDSQPLAITPAPGSPAVDPERLQCCPESQPPGLQGTPLGRHFYLVFFSLEFLNCPDVFVSMYVLVKYSSSTNLSIL